MPNVNFVIEVGHLTGDPELRYIPSGTAVVKMNLAVNNNFKTKSGEEKKEVLFIELEAWGRQAEVCGEYLKKGSAVMIEGRLVLDTWENKEGQKRSKHKIRVDRVHFLGKPSNSIGSNEGEDELPEEDNPPADPVTGEKDEIPF